MRYESSYVWIVFKRHIDHWDTNDVVGVYMMREKAEEIRQYHTNMTKDEKYYFKLERHEVQ